MRSASAALAIVGAAALCGCASVGDAMKVARDAVQPGPVAAGSTGAPARPAPEAPVAPAIKAMFDQAAALMKAGRTADAERAFKALADAHPELGGPHANLGLIHRQAGRLPEAAKALETATRLNARQPLYWNQLGVTYRQQGRFAEARTAYEKAIALDAGYAAPVLNLGILHDLYLGDGAPALELYTRYLAMTGGDATVTKWVADLRNRKPAPVTVGLANRAHPKEIE